MHRTGTIGVALLSVFVGCATTGGGGEQAPTATVPRIETTLVYVEGMT